MSNKTRKRIRNTASSRHSGMASTDTGKSVCSSSLGSLRDKCAVITEYLGKHWTGQIYSYMRSQKPARGGDRVLGSKIETAFESVHRLFKKYNYGTQFLTVFWIISQLAFFSQTLQLVLICSYLLVNLGKEDLPPRQRASDADEADPTYHISQLVAVNVREILRLARAPVDLAFEIARRMRAAALDTSAANGKQKTDTLRLRAEDAAMSVIAFALGANDTATLRRHYRVIFLSMLVLMLNPAALISTFFA